MEFINQILNELYDVNNHRKLESMLNGDVYDIAYCQGVEATIQIIKHELYEHKLKGD